MKIQLQYVSIVYLFLTISLSSLCGSDVAAHAVVVAPGRGGANKNNENSAGSFLTVGNAPHLRMTRKATSMMIHGEEKMLLLRADHEDVTDDMHRRDDHRNLQGEESPYYNGSNSSTETEAPSTDLAGLLGYITGFIVFIAIVYACISGKC